MDYYTQEMRFSYKDGTNASMGIAIDHEFLKGSIDNLTGSVSNWDNAIKYLMTFFTDSYNEGGKRVTGRHSVQGYSIFNGTRDDFSVSSQDDGWGGWFTSASGTGGGGNGWLGFMSFGQGNVTIGEVSLSTRDYTHNGTAYKESRANFDVNVDAVVGTGSNNFTMPAIISYEVIHNVTHNYYKYGVYMNWTDHKDFPTAYPMNTGDNYFLVSRDLLESFYDTGNATGGILKQYYTDNSGLNKTTIYKDPDTNETLLTQYLPLTYDAINETGYHEEFNTLIHYLYEGWYSDGGGLYEERVYGSNMFVVKDGFKWNESTGIYFDPAVLVPCALYSGQDDPGDPGDPNDPNDPDGLNNIPGYDLFILIGAIIGFTGIISILRKKRMI